MPPHGPHHHKWLVNVEYDQRSLADVASDLRNIADCLAAGGAIELEQAGQKHQLNPSDPCSFVLRYELMPRGEHKLKIELEWEPGNSTARSGVVAIRKPSKP